ncbi:hypothetical protein KSP39_PZI012667 [Platanthera zijinensis]|uniref:Uncharacterized protein n=1 Tax=Platanthera zijinensis TaxID=2320716 RepID=A0AAP0BFH8_9ASPA
MRRVAKLTRRSWLLAQLGGALPHRRRTRGSVRGGASGTTGDLSRVYRAMLRKQQTLLATLGRTTPVHHGVAPLANLPDRTRGKTF